MKESFYGNFQQADVADDVSRHVEEIAVRGFTIIPGIFDEAELKVWRAKIEAVYAQQEAEFGKEILGSMHEVDVCRAPLLYDFDFVNMAAHPAVMAVVQRILGEWCILNLQNAIINRPGTDHHQSSWHRDLPYQNFVISKPLAINALIALDPFSAETGGTQLVPFSHKTEVLPSDAYIANNRITASAPAGSAILFDAMVFHRAGKNTSTIIRYAVNHLYTAPIIKQFYDFPKALEARGLNMDPAIARLLGFSSRVPLDDKAWRKARLQRMKGMADA